MEKCDLSFRIKKIVDILEREYEKWDVPVKRLKKINFKNKFHILISSLISTRTKDEITKKVMEKFVEKVKKPEDVLNMDIDEIEKIIYPVGFYKIKAKNIKKISEIIVKKYKGKIVEDFNELLKLPGVGRKVAKIVLSYGFNKNVIAVDTHVSRISTRIGIVKTKNVKEIEEKLEEIVPSNLKRKINYLFVALGQKICLPKKPKCFICPIEKYCDKII